MHKSDDGIDEEKCEMNLKKIHEEITDAVAEIRTAVDHIRKEYTVPFFCPLIEAQTHDLKYASSPLSFADIKIKLSHGASTMSFKEGSEYYLNTYFAKETTYRIPVGYKKRRKEAKVRNEDLGKRQLSHIPDEDIPNNEPILSKRKGFNAEENVASCIEKWGKQNGKRMMIFTNLRIPDRTIYYPRDIRFAVHSQSSDTHRYRRAEFELWQPGGVGCLQVSPPIHTLKACDSLKISLNINSLVAELAGVSQAPDYKGESPAIIELGVFDQYTFTGCENALIIVIDPYRLFQCGKGIKMKYWMNLFTRTTSQHVHVYWPKDEALRMWRGDLDSYDKLTENRKYLTEEDKKARWEFTEDGRKSTEDIVEKLDQNNLIIKIPVSMDEEIIQM
ncbi:hypothetical protein BSL78_23649 [Apostichopus japonicus]|uniref:Uncharacterized protein n=1 Tax=Stichopus japonicus TaxID=307972 RepID=A0A2G8JUZ0_STIJA|nr:hypothetical protein BSL78_23649 [Apostichopus japonicus]